jgi:tripartite-type tricarboxylate transporter receptor subunit TctC
VTNRRQSIAASAAIATGVYSSFSFAQNWPARTIKIIVPFTPGGTTDFVSRLMGTELAKSLGVPVIIENKPGAGTVIGVDLVAKAAADGYTFVCIANSFCVNQTLVKKLPYDTLKDFKPVALMGMSEHVLVTHPNSGIKKLRDLVNLSKLSYASFGQGTSAHLAGEMLKAQLGADIAHIPYKGQAPALADLLGGQVSIMFGNWPEFRGYVESGKLLTLGMATARRSHYAPHIPTLIEQGVNVESNSWNGLLAPSATPSSVIVQLNAEIAKILNSSAVLDVFQKSGIASLSASPRQFTEFIQLEIKRYADIIRLANITAEG